MTGSSDTRLHALCFKQVADTGVGPSRPNLQDSIVHEG